MSSSAQPVKKDTAVKKKTAADLAIEAAEVALPGIKAASPKTATLVKATIDTKNMPMHLS